MTANIRQDEKRTMYGAYITETEKGQIDKTIEGFRNIGGGMVRVGDVLAAILKAATKTENQEFIAEVRRELQGG